MKVYEAVFKEGETEGVYALSVVENPAMEDMWITLSEQPQKIELFALIPGFSTYMHGNWEPTNSIQ